MITIDMNCNACLSVNDGLHTYAQQKYILAHWLPKFINDYYDRHSTRGSYSYQVPRYEYCRHLATVTLESVTTDVVMAALQL